MATAYKFISSVTVGGGGAANMTFTSIPATYTDLLLKISTRVSSTNGTTYIDYNSDTADQSWTRLYNSGGTTGSDTGSRQLITSVTSDYTASTFASTEIYIPNYAVTSVHPSSVESTQENDSASNVQMIITNFWNNAAAITAIRIVPFSGTFDQYSTAFLYGISNA